MVNSPALSGLLERVEEVEVHRTRPLRARLRFGAFATLWILVGLGSAWRFRVCFGLCGHDCMSLTGASRQPVRELI